MRVINYLWYSAGIKFLLKKDKIQECLEKKDSSLLEYQVIYFGKPPYQYVVTYKNLIKDMVYLNSKDNDRTALLKRIIDTTPLKNGSILIGYDSPKSFWDSVNFFANQHKINYIIIFGIEAQSDLINLPKHHFGLFSYNDHNVLILPSIDEMLPNNIKAKKIAWEFLKNLKKTR